MEGLVRRERDVISLKARVPWLALHDRVCTRRRAWRCRKRACDEGLEPVIAGVIDNRRHIERERWLPGLNADGGPCRVRGRALGGRLTAELAEEIRPVRGLEQHVVVSPARRPNCH